VDFNIMGIFLMVKVGAQEVSHDALLGLDLRIQLVIQHDFPHILFEDTFKWAMQFSSQVDEIDQGTEAHDRDRHGQASARLLFHGGDAGGSVPWDPRKAALYEKYDEVSIYSRALPNRPLPSQCLNKIPMGTIKVDSCELMPPPHTPTTESIELLIHQSTCPHSPRRLAFMNPWLSGMHWTARQRR
jgi:hypothetical protein